MRKSRTARRNDAEAGAAATEGSSARAFSDAFTTSQLTEPSASLRACSEGAERSSFFTSGPSSPKSENGATTNEMRRADAIVSPSKHPVPVRTSRSISTDALGKCRSRLMSMRPTSSRAESIFPASRLTKSAISPRKSVGAARATATRTASATAAPFTNFPISEPYYGRRPKSPPLRIPFSGRAPGPPSAPARRSA